MCVHAYRGKRTVGMSWHAPSTMEGHLIYVIKFGFPDPTKGLKFYLPLSLSENLGFFFHLVHLNLFPDTHFTQFPSILL